MKTTSITRLLWGGAVLAALTAPAAAGTTQQDAEEIERAVRARIEFGRERSEIGVAVRDMEDAASGGAASSGDGVDEGAVVTGVREGGPAAAAGVEPGDVIVTFDGERVRGARQLARIVQETPAGRAAPVRVLRDGAPVALTVTPEAAAGGMGRLAERVADRVRLEVDEDESSEILRLEAEELDGFLGRPEVLRLEAEEFALRRLPEIMRGVRRWTGRVRLGIRADSVDGQLAEYFGAEAGVLVEHVDDGAPGAAAGLRAGDVITAIDGNAVDDLPALRRQLARLDAGEAFEITVVRDRAETSLTAETAAPEEPDRRRRRRRPSI